MSHLREVCREVLKSPSSWENVADIEYIKIQSCSSQRGLNEPTETAVSRPLRPAACSLRVRHGYNRGVQGPRGPAPEGACETTLEHGKVKESSHYIDFYIFGI